MRVWTGHKITSTGLITIVILYSSLMSQSRPYCLHCTAQLARVWRRHGERFQTPSWCGLVSAEVEEHRGSTCTIVMRGLMTSVCYRGETLDVYVAGAIELQFILARPHRAMVFEDHLQQETVIRSKTYGLASTSIRTGQQAHLISTRASMSGTCYP